MARRVEEIKRVRREIDDTGQSSATQTMTDDEKAGFEEEFYDIDESVPEETGMNTASGVLALVLLALAVYLIWAAIR